MRRSALAVCALGVLLLAACSGFPLLASDSDEPPHVDSIEPLSATFGDEIVIRGSGFDRESNTIGFGPLADGSDAYMNGVPSPDTETLRFELAGVMGVCGPAYPPPEESEPCIAIGVVLPLGDLEVSVSNEHGISNRLAFTREKTHAQVAEIEVNDSAEYKRLTEELDRWIAEDFVPASSSEYAAASYSFTIGGGPKAASLFIEFNLRNIDPEAVPIPDEIEGYEVQVNATSVIVGS